MFKARVEIRLKKGIADPEGVNTLKALHLLGFDSVKEVKSVKVFDIFLEGKNEENARRQVEKMCQRLLTNPVIHLYNIEVNKI
ncbi:MAG: phosphoribosylformylglycinamidine synthase [Thermoplasmata archaeon]|nr:MAG: phosphoribosylformylglycinamidine synthase subunit PurS [Thermoplasmata archaeon]MCD6108154.1 phosphoribosylformylglycinamidine synthase subunit PurS [Thermoplasmata archaeon]RLF30455.1 MAG: phosphoribosylformylglycinamidine synthase [Thermoplasmata archaeon]RLF60889.1 MAG: phosphoribosylformylglycinamidine synthase [Thermoplasmata archaeon]HDM25625.1 phosphoribosylformylglycinamidine synthase, purS protein [Thermoplasmatales archaeon]